MSYKEKSIVVSLASYILILSYFGFKLNQFYQAGPLVPGQVFRLWGVIIVLQILVNIIGNIIANIVTSAIQMARTNEVEDFVEDERDKIIGLKGTRNAYIFHSIFVGLAMLIFVLGQPPLLMFNLLILSGLLAGIFEEISQLIMYRRGF
jgi:uncharacterized BrkB/YihY/UPF0761 family membrane protein